MAFKIRRRLGLLLFGLVLWLLGEPVPIAWCPHCGRHSDAVCHEHITALTRRDSR